MPLSLSSLGAAGAEGEACRVIGGREGVSDFSNGFNQVPDPKVAKPFFYELCEWGLLPCFAAKYTARKRNG